MSDDIWGDIKRDLVFIIKNIWVRHTVILLYYLIEFIGVRFWFFKNYKLYLLMTSNHIKLLNILADRTGVDRVPLKCLSKDAFNVFARAGCFNSYMIYICEVGGGSKGNTDKH